MSPNATGSEPAVDAKREDAIVEALAEHLATEHDFENNMSPGHQWPLHENDDGYRGDGYVRLIPRDVQEHRRDDARRIMMFLASSGYLSHSTLTTRAERAEAEVKRLRDAFTRSNDEICQTLGKALGYPWFCDDQRNFPGTTRDNGVCVGDHVAETIAMEAAQALVTIKSAETARDAALAEVERLREAHRHAGALMFALLGRPDVMRLFGPFENTLFEGARVSNNAALAAPGGQPA